MISQENLDKLVEMQVIDKNKINELSQEDIIQAMMDKLIYFENQLTPGVQNIADRYKKLSTDKIAYKKEITTKRCQELYDSWKSYTAVAEYLGVSIATVRRRLGKQ